MTIGRRVRLAVAGASVLAAGVLVGAITAFAQSPAASPAASLAAGSAPAIVCPSPAASFALASPATEAEQLASPIASVAAVGSPSASIAPSVAPCPPASPTAASVTIRDFAFDPLAITVSAGATVTWTNEGPSGHTVTADDGSFDSMVIAPGSLFEMTFDTPGTYAYHCKPHPDMTATIVVE